MSEQPTLTLTSRAQLGSGAARRLRQQGRIPAVLYGHGAPRSVLIDGTEFRHTVSPAHYGSLMVQVRLDGQDMGLALVKAVQVNTMNQRVLAVDLQRVSRDDRLVVSVPIVLEGEPAGARLGGVLEVMMHATKLRCQGTNVPAQLTYDVSMLEITDAVHLGQLALPPGSELLDKPDDVVAVLVAPTIPALEEPVEIEPGLTGPELTGEKQKESLPPAA